MTAIIEDLHEVTNQELNAALEAHRQTKFREHLEAFGDNGHITAPEVYWDYCGPHLICMERLTGVPMDHFDVLAERGVDGELMLRRGIKVWIEAALVHGPFHGDVHAGNLWMLDDGRAAFLEQLKLNLAMAEQYGATVPKELVLIAKQLLYFERYSKTLAPDYVMARDLYLLKNVFPEAVAAAAQAQGITLPD